MVHLVEIQHVPLCLTPYIAVTFGVIQETLLELLSVSTQVSDLIIARHI